MSQPPNPPWGQHPPHYPAPGSAPPRYGSMSAPPTSQFPPPMTMHQPYAGWPQQRPRPRRRWPWLLAGATAIAAVVVLLGFSMFHWGATRFSDGAVEAGVVKILRDHYGITNIGTARCPAGELIETGKEFTCQVEIDGSQRTVRITVKDATGTCEVSRDQQSTRGFDLAARNELAHSE